MKDISIQWPGVRQRTDINEITLRELWEKGRLSERGHNICISRKLATVGSLLDFYNSNGAKGFYLMRNSGKKTTSELISICQRYSPEVLSHTRNYVPATEPALSVNSYVTSLNIPDADYYFILNEISGYDYFPLFKVISILIDRNFAFANEIHTKIFKHSFHCYLPVKHYTNLELSKQSGLSGERLRQMREAICKKFLRGFTFFIGLDVDVLIGNYFRITDQPLILIDEDEANKINQKEGTQFSSLFITYVISVIYTHQFTIVGDLKALTGNPFFRKDSAGRHIFLVNRRISGRFDFTRFLDFMKEQERKKRREEVYLSYSTLIDRYKTGDLIVDPEFRTVINTILSNDFNDFIRLDEDGITLLKNAPQKLDVEIIEVLKNAGKPLHYSEIYQQLAKLHQPHIKEVTVRVKLAEDIHIFGLKGSGIYGLRSEGGLFGSIGDVAAQILKLNGSPLRYKKLEKLICKELIVSKASIRVMLFGYKNEKRFSKDKDEMVSLKNEELPRQRR